MNVSKPRYKGHTGRSSSFKQPLHYITHDKDGAGDSRVGFVAFLNLAAEESGAAAREMQTTVAASKALQARARIAEGKRPGGSGKAVDHPVYAFTLSWHPSEKPEAGETLAAARDALKVLGLQDHQTVIAAHRDRPHSHVHVVVNLVHPDTGRVANMRLDEKKLDRWAYQYEVQHKMIRSFKRAAKHEPKLGEQTPAQRSAASIKKAYATARESLKQKQANDRTVHAEEATKAWADYRVQKQAVYKKYGEMLDSVWTRRGQDPAMRPKPPKFLYQKPEWKAVAQAMKAIAPERSNGNPWVAPPILRKLFKSAQHAFVPHNTSDRTSRQFQWAKDSRVPEDFRPLKGQFKTIQPGRPYLHKRERADHLKLARSAELHELALSHLRKTESFEKAEIVLREKHEFEWKTLKADSDKVWEKWRNEFKQPVKQDFKRTAEAEKPAQEKAPVTEKPVQDAAQSNQAKQAKPAKQYYRTETSPADSERQFGDYIRSCGLVLKGSPIMDGRWHNIPVEGQKSGKSGGYRGFLDGAINGQVKNHKTGVQIPDWTPEGERVPVSYEQTSLFAKEADARREKRDAEIIAEKNNAALLAKLRLDQTQPASRNHPYLQAKGIDRHGVRQDDQGKLLIPRQNIAGELRSYQTIDRKGVKLYQPEGEVKGTFFVIGDINKPGPIIEVEGFATGATLHEATGACVVVAFDKGNLLHVAKAIREAHPDREILIGADQDQWTFTQKGFEDAGRPDKDKIQGDDPRWVEWRAQGYLENGGMDAAHDAAEYVGGTVIAPPISADDPGKNKDWNDYAGMHGLSAVATHFPSTASHERSGNEMAIEHDGYEMD